MKLDEKLVSLRKEKGITQLKKDFQEACPFGGPIADISKTFRLMYRRKIPVEGDSSTGIQVIRTHRYLRQ